MAGIAPSWARDPSRRIGHLVVGLGPYTLLPIIGVILADTWRAGSNGIAEIGLAVGAGALVTVIVLRQILLLFENRRLHRVSAAYSERMEWLNATLTEANSGLEATATTDHLTGLPNHRAMVQALDRAIEQSETSGQPFATLFLDLDHFKALNDAYGHGTGDESLREWGRVVGAEMRASDTLGRWGGEEFVAVMPGMPRGEAVRAAERIRGAVAWHTFPSGGLHLTCSIGLACYPTDATDRDRVIELADRALYAAKRLGRNQVRWANEVGVEALMSDSEKAGTREETAVAGTVDALVALVDARDRYTGQHTHDVGNLALRVAVALGIGAREARMIGLAGRLHDIGKVAVPDAVLQKVGALTPAEWAIVRTHPAVGAAILSRVPALRPVAPLVRGHHERWDGRGYPDRLAGEGIPLGARVLAVVDAFEAMTTERPYQAARSAALALMELRRASRSQIDPVVVAALTEVLAADPGSPRPTAPPPETIVTPRVA